MNNHNSDSPIVKRAQHAIDQTIADPTDAELERFATMRKKALDAMPAETKGAHREGWLVSRNPWLSTAFAILFTLGIGVTVWHSGNGALPATQDSVLGANIDDLELLTADVDLELLENDVEFYQWVAEQAEAEET